MVVYEDTVEPLFLAELCALDYLVEGFVCGLEYSNSKSDLTLHPIVNARGLATATNLWPCLSTVPESS